MQILDKILDIPIKKLLNNSGQLLETHGIPENPRRITKIEYEKLLASIRDSDLSQIKPLQVIPYDGNTFIVLAGNQRLRAYRKLKFKTVKCFVLSQDLPAKIYQKIIITDNSHFGSNDDDLLANMFEAEDLLDWGVELPELEIDIIPEETEGDDDVPESAPAITVKGDLYTLGEHRLLCGDSTMIDDVEKLMDGEKADMVFTDPPYGMNAVSNSGVLSKNYKSDILNDDSVNVAKNSFNLCLSLNINKMVFWGANYYSSSLPDSSCWLVWDKNNGQSDQMDCELAWTNLKGCTRQYTQASEKTNRVHPTQKPVSLAEWCFAKYDANTVIDLFLGSGSTLIACEKTNRKCYGMELDEKYCDVIVKRYIEFCVKNNKEAKVYRNGELINNEVFLV